MSTLSFRYTNRQLFIGCASGFFSIMFFIAFGFILLNFNDMVETHLIETIFITVMGGLMIISFIKRLSGGSELKSKLELSGTSIIIKGEHRYMLKDLQLDEYESADYHCFHLYTRDKDFTLYTNEKDDFIKHLMKSDIDIEQFEIEQYEFERNSSTVMIKASKGRMLGFNLDTGSFTIFREDDEDKDKPTYEPKHFIQTPGYRLKK